MVIIILDGDSMKIMHYSLIVMLAAAPLLAYDDSQNSAMAQQGEAQPQDDSKQPKTFLNRCYEDRYYIIAGVGLLAIAAAAAYLYYYNGLKNLSTEPINLDLSKESNAFVYPKGYSELSKQRVDQLRKIHPVFDKICCGSSYDRVYRCDYAVQELEKMYSGNNRCAGIGVAGMAIDELAIPDPIERINAKTLIEQSVNNLNPALIKQSVDTFNPISDQSNSDSWDYFYRLLPG